MSSKPELKLRLSPKEIEYSCLELKDAINKARREVGNQVLCRNCKEPMKQAPYGILAFYCHKCNVKAEINYSNIPIVHLKELSHSK